MNNVILIGRLTRDPELRYIPSGTAVCKFTLAVDKGISKSKKQELESQNKPTADFINIVVWNKTAESCANHLAKGLKVAVQGRLESGSYEKEGQRVYTTDVIANEVEFLEWKNNQENNNQSGFYQTEDKDIPF